MVSSPGSRGLSRLLTLLDAEPEAASTKYIELREKLVRILLWKGCPEVSADSLADTILDRVVAKLEADEEIADVGAYAAGVLRFVWLEYSRKNKEDAAGDDLPETPYIPSLEATPDDADRRLACLRTCLDEICRNESDRHLIVGYYDTTRQHKNKDVRRLLAEKLGLTATALRVRACRLRDKLETCINSCVANETKIAGIDTNNRGGER